MMLMSDAPLEEFQGSFIMYKFCISQLNSNKTTIVED